MKRTKEILRQFVYVVAALFMCVLTFISGQGKLSVYRVFADSVSAFDDSPISEDLQDINPLLYLKNPTGGYELLRLTEFCYSERPFLSEYYGLYVYIYNPTQTELEKEYNTVIMATAYDTNGTASSYESFNLVWLDNTSNHRFYKFKVSNSSKAKNAAEEYAVNHNGERKYEISDIDLRPSSLKKKTDGVSRKYYFSGYAKGCSDSTKDESSLSSRYEGLDSIDLEVNHTFYRADEVYKAYTYQEIDSVYFAVPEKYFEEYGGLQKIKSTWYEYKTSPVFVTFDTSAYTALKEYIGAEIGEKDESLKYRVLWEESYVLGSEYIYYSFGKDYNHLEDSTIHGMNIYDFGNLHLSRFDWLFETEGKSYEGYQISRETVLKYIEDYTDKHPSQTKLAGKYAEKLFADNIDENRIELLDNPEEKCGKVTQEIDAEEDVFDLIQWKDQAWWQKFLSKPHETETIMENVSPISVVESADLELSQKDFCEKFLVDSSDYDSVIAYCTDTLKQTGTAKARPVIFHFAQTDYYSSTARFDYYRETWGDGYTVADPDGYVAQETVFLDYKIISLSFRKSGNDTIVAVVSDPIDIINGFDPPNDNRLFDDDSAFPWKRILAIILLILLLVFLAPILPYIVRVVIWIIALPFKLIGALFKGIKNSFHKRE